MFRACRVYTTYIFFDSTAFSLFGTHKLDMNRSLYKFQQQIIIGSAVLVSYLGNSFKANREKFFPSDLLPTSFSPIRFRARVMWLRKLINTSRIVTYNQANLSAMPRNILQGSCIIGQSLNAEQSQINNDTIK